MAGRDYVTQEALRRSSLQAWWAIEAAAMVVRPLGVGEGGGTPGIRL